MKRLVGLILLYCLVTGLGYGQDQPGGGSIRGVVRNQKGEPVSDVKVSIISRLTDKRVAQVLTDQKGRFAVADLPGGRYALVFFSPSYERALIRSLAVKRGQEKIIKRPVRLSPAKQEAIINGAVFNQKGFLLPGAQVIIEQLPPQDDEAKPVKLLKRKTVTNSSGEFAVRVPGIRARYRVTAKAKGYSTESKIIDIGGAERRHLAIELDPAP